MSASLSPRTPASRPVSCVGGGNAMSVVARQAERSREHTSTQRGMRPPIPSEPMGGHAMQDASAPAAARANVPEPLSGVAAQIDRPVQDPIRSRRHHALTLCLRHFRRPHLSGHARPARRSPQSHGDNVLHVGPVIPGPRRISRTGQTDRRGTWLTSSRWDAASRTGATAARCRSRSSPIASASPRVGSTRSSGACGVSTATPSSTRSPTFFNSTSTCS